MLTIKNVLEKFEENVFGDCFAGGTFVDNEKQAMYTSGFKEGFNKAKNMSKQFLQDNLTSMIDDIKKVVALGIQTELYFLAPPEMISNITNNIVKKIGQDGEINIINSHK